MIYLDLFQTWWFILAITTLATIFFTSFTKKILIKADISDKPIVTEHKHKSGTPTMGGIGMLMGILFMTSIYFKNTYLLITCLIMLVSGLVGLMDDLLGLKTKEVQKIAKNISSTNVEIGLLTLKPNEEARVASPQAKKALNYLLSEGKLEVIGEAPIKTEIEESHKIILQIVIGLFLVLTSSVTMLGPFSLGLLAIPMIIVGILGAINSMNLIDGMDGLAAGIMTIASATCAIFLNFYGNFDASLPFIGLTAVSLGFLALNKYPAKIFMGDTGSFALGAGFATAVMLTNTVLLGVIALAVPIISVIVSLMHRAHIINLPVEPLHHTLNYKGMSEKSIILLYWGLTVIFSAIGLLFVPYFPL